MSRISGLGLAILLMGLAAEGVHGTETDVAACENELLSEDDIRRWQVSPSRGVANPMQRMEASRKTPLKTSVADTLRQRKPEALPTPSSDTLELQRRYLRQKQRLVREHRGSENELAQAVAALKQRVFDEVQP